MKSIYFHVIYLSIIAFLGYNYWSSVQAFKAFEHLDKQLKVDYELLKGLESLVYKSIEKNCKTYPNVTNLVFLGKSEIVTTRGNQAIDFIENNKKQLNLDTISSVNYKPINPNNSFFNSDKIREIKNDLTKFKDSLIYLIDDSKDKKVIEEQLCLTKIINNEFYWNNLKHFPLNGVAAELSSLKNQIQADKILIFNYLDHEMRSGVLICGPEFRTAIAPKKAALIEGETFEADIYLAKYESVPNANLIIKVNGKRLEINQGVAHFKSKNQTVGTKTIKAEAAVRNPLTGAITTSVGVFEYQVLPKCSRDCL